jgi:hypothetical protein
MMVYVQYEVKLIWDVRNMSKHVCMTSHVLTADNAALPFGTTHARKSNKVQDKGIGTMCT